MRIYADCKQLMTEAIRDVMEMGHLVEPKTYQNKNIEGNPNFVTREVLVYQYCLVNDGKLNTDPLFITDPRSKEWVNGEFKERIFWKGGTIMNNPGEAYHIREEIWRPFLIKEGHLKGSFDYSYNERFRFPIRLWDINKKDKWDNNLNRVINLLKKDPGTRKAILPIFSMEDVKYNDGSKRIPCSMYYNFLVREDAKGVKRVNLLYHQRSSDVFTHFGNDVALAIMMIDYMAKQTGYGPGNLYHLIDSFHSYQKDWDSLRDLINEF